MAGRNIHKVPSPLRQHFTSPLYLPLRQPIALPLGALVRALQSHYVRLVASQTNAVAAKSVGRMRSRERGTLD